MATTRSATAKLTDLLDPKFMARLDSLDLLSRKILQGKLQGERRSKRRGQSVEFADHRAYVAATTCASSTGTSTAGSISFS